jgi:hypothetical protein
MIGVEGNNFFNKRFLVIYKYFQVEITHEVEVHFIPVITDGHDECAMLV